MAPTVSPAKAGALFVSVAPSTLHDDPATAHSWPKSHVENSVLSKVYEDAFAKEFAKAYERASNSTLSTPSPVRSDNYAIMSGVYVTAVLFIYAASIAFMVGLISMKRNRSKELDKQATHYLQGLYDRRLTHEREQLCHLTAALGPLPSIMLPMVTGTAGMKTSAVALPASVATAVVPAIAGRWRKAQENAIAKTTTKPASLESRSLAIKNYNTPESNRDIHSGTLSDGEYARSLDARGEANILTNTRDSSRDLATHDLRRPILDMIEEHVELEPAGFESVDDGEHEKALLSGHR